MSKDNGRSVLLNGVIQMLPKPDETNSSANTCRVLDTLSLLTPWDVVGCGKIRIGGDHDGGYVMLDRLRPEQPVLSYGVGPDVSFDFDLARRGHPVFMFDHTVGGPPTALPPNALFTREGVAAEPQPEKQLDTVENHLRRHGLLGRRDIILKLDIEGQEWRILSSLPEDLLDVFEQIVVEFHWLNGLGNRDLATMVENCLERLNGLFTLCHVHANNHVNFRLVEGIIVPPVLEATYVRSDLVSRIPNQTLYPTEHDRGNRIGVKDMLLAIYPFMPMAVPAPELRLLAQRVDAEYASRMASQPPTPPPHQS